jgi:hypothetical protein
VLSPTISNLEYPCKAVGVGPATVWHASFGGCGLSTIQTSRTMYLENRSEISLQLEILHQVVVPSTSEK